MARFKFRKARRSSTGGFRRFARRASKSGSNANLMTTALAAAAYGAARPKVEEMIQPFTSKIPVVGNYADELVLGGIGYFAAKGKFGNNKIVKAAGTAMLILEAARVGNGLSQGLSPVAPATKSNFTANWGN